MMRPKNRIVLFLFWLILAEGGSCVKSSFLDRKPSTNLEVPTSLEDFQSLLDNTVVMSPTPVLGDISADNFYLTADFWQGLDTKEHNAYTWATDIFEGRPMVDDWDLPYKQVFYANVVLAGLPGVKRDSANRETWDRLSGAALFIRAYAFHNLVQVFAPVYDANRSATDPGIPLRLNPDINPVSTRATLEQTYQRILDDLKTAAPLLPAAVSLNTLNRPTRPAVFALLARVYLSMGAYNEARLYADSCLQLYSGLIRYSDLLPNFATTLFPFPVKNPETVYPSSILPSTKVLAAEAFPNCIVDTFLYRSYDSNDLRKIFFYKLNGQGQPNIKGSYTGNVFPFTGLATDEVYLIRAEGAAWMGDRDSALSDLNALLQNRYKDGSFVPKTASTAADALKLVRLERRKELAFRGVRWSDLRRYNKEGAGINLVRLVDGPDTLQAGSHRWVLPIPPDVIANSQMPQNPR
jgi:hypothetical protein